MKIKYLNGNKITKLKNVKKIHFIKTEKGTKIKVILNNSIIIPIIDVKTIITIENKKYNNN